QLFAEATAAYRNNERWWPDAAFEREIIHPEQDARFEADPWQEIVAAWMEANERPTTMEIAKGALNIQTDRLGTSDARRIRDCLHALKYKQLPKDWRSRREWVRGP